MITFKENKIEERGEMALKEVLPGRVPQHMGGGIPGKGEKEEDPWSTRGGAEGFEPFPERRKDPVDVDAGRRGAAGCAAVLLCT